MRDHHLDWTLALTRDQGIKQDHVAENKIIAYSLSSLNFATGGRKRAYLVDLEAWGTTGYLKPWNVLAKALLILLDPFSKTLQDVAKYLEKIDEQESRGIITDTSFEELSFESEWTKRWPQTRAAIVANAVKTISTDILRKTYEHIALASCSARITDRLTKLIDKSAERKLQRYGTRFFTDRPRVAVRLLKTTAWGLALGRLAAFSYEMISMNWFLYKSMGAQHYFKPTKHKFQRMIKWTMKRAAYYTLQWGCYCVCVSIGGAFDAGFLGKGAGCNLGYVFGDVLTDAISVLFEDFLVDQENQTKTISD